MKLTFVGTRGDIEARSQRHHRHSALLVSHRGRRVLIDCGRDWLGHFERFRPDAIVLTHAHPDHTDGLSNGAPCPVFATASTWRTLSPCHIGQREIIRARVPTKIFGLIFEAFPVEHSIIAPAVGWKITAGRVSFFYAPDIVSIHQTGAALPGIRLYIGDGASLVRPILRRRGKHLIGHASIRQQLDWCAKHHVPRAIFTHCGSQIVSGCEPAIAKWLYAVAAERKIEAAIAYDGMSLTLR